jgi:hypothetical protein
MSAKLRVVIYWLILSDKRSVSMGRNQNRCVDLLDGKERNSKKRADWMKLFQLNK